MTDRFQAALFDFGGTLFSYRRVGAEAIDLIRRGAERLGVESELATLGKAYREASRAAYEAFGRRPFYLHRDLFQDTFRRFAAQLGTSATPELLDWYYEEQRVLLLEGFELREGCVEILQSLRDQGLHVGVVSNIDDDYLVPMLERAGLAHVLDAWTSSEEAASCKPDPGIFQHALRKADACPEDVLFVGDSREHDVAGARRLGMTTVLIQEAGATAPGAGVGEAGEPHHVIESLAEVVPILRRPQAR